MLLDDDDTDSSELMVRNINPQYSLVYIYTRKRVVKGRENCFRISYKYNIIDRRSIDHHTQLTFDSGNITTLEASKEP